MARSSDTGRTARHTGTGRVSSVVLANHRDSGTVRGQRGMLGIDGEERENE